MRQIYVKPRAGVNVRDEISKRHIPEAGCLVPESSYWVRCIAAGDVVVSQPPVVNQIPDSNATKPKE